MSSWILALNGLSEFGFVTAVTFGLGPGLGMASLHRLYSAGKEGLNKVHPSKMEEGSYLPNRADFNPETKLLGTRSEDKRRPQRNESQPIRNSKLRDAVSISQLFGS
jgi:hypothetical protein